MLSLLMFDHDYLSLIFSHICHHKTLTTVLLSLSTFPSCLPNPLPKEKGTSSTSLYPQSPLSDVTTDVSGLDHRGTKMNLLAYQLWHFETRRDKDTSETGRSAL